LEKSLEALEVEGASVGEDLAEHTENSSSDESLSEPLSLSLQDLQTMLGGSESLLAVEGENTQDQTGKLTPPQLQVPCIIRG
jgi:hypothetical protein